VKPTRQDKYRQVEEFIRELDTVLKPELLPTGRALRVVDLGCGNAHLSFAAYRYLTKMRGLDVTLVGVDVKRQARERNNALAAQLGWDGISFVEGTIAEAPVDGADVVLALHACDTATDDAIAKGIAAGSELIVVAPCCHKQIRREMEAAHQGNDLDFLTRHGIFLERQAEMVTDAMRAMILEHIGYSTKVFEFISDQHTPKNVQIVATKTNRSKDAAALQRLKDAKAYFGIRRHHLEDAVGL
jgi:SAM-dependent methyltransferase